MAHDTTIAAVQAIVPGTYDPEAGLSDEQLAVLVAAWAGLLENWAEGFSTLGTLGLAERLERQGQLFLHVADWQQVHRPRVAWALMTALAHLGLARIALKADQPEMALARVRHARAVLERL